MAAIDLATGAVKHKIEAGIAPYGAVVNAAGTSPCVINWGGRLATPGDRTTPTGYRDNAARVVVDNSGIASTGAASRIDLDARKIINTIATRLHPTSIVWD